MDYLKFISRVHSFFVFSETIFQDFSRTQIDFSRSPKCTIIEAILQTIVSKENVFTRVQRFPGLSKTRLNFPGLSSPGKCQNRIPRLSGISRTLRNPYVLRICFKTKQLIREDDLFLLFCFLQGCSQKA